MEHLLLLLAYENMSNYIWAEMVTLMHTGWRLHAVQRVEWNSLSVRQLPLQ